MGEGFNRGKGKKIFLYTETKSLSSVDKLKGVFGFSRIRKRANITKLGFPFGSCLIAFRLGRRFNLSNNEDKNDFPFIVKIISFLIFPSKTLHNKVIVKNHVLFRIVKNLLSFFLLNIIKNSYAYDIYFKTKSLIFMG